MATPYIITPVEYLTTKNLRRTNILAQIPLAFTSQYNIGMSSPTPFTGFPPSAFTFLRGLKRNNKKPWFEARREMYEAAVKQPLQLFVEEVDAQLGTIAPEIVGTPKRSIFRIYRDVRFSADKSPYKTVASCWFYHRDIGHGVGQRTHGGAGFYFQISPEESFVAAGIWMPPSSVLKQLRAAVADDYTTMNTLLRTPALCRTFGSLNEEQMLTRTPRGFAPDHPAGRLLLHKSYMVSQDLTEAQLTSARLIDLVVKSYATALPLVRWLNSALGYRSALRR